MAYDEPLASRGWTPFLPPPEGQSVDLRGYMPPRSSGEALPAGRNVPPAGLAALPAAPLESQGWGAGERSPRGTGGASAVRWHGCRLCPPTPPGARAATPSAGPSCRRGLACRGPDGRWRPLSLGGPALTPSNRPAAPLPHHSTGVCSSGEGSSSPRNSPCRGGRGPLAPPWGPAGSSRDVFPALDTPCRGPPPCSRPVNRPCRCQRGPYGGSNDVVGARRGADPALYTPAGALQGGNPPRGGPTGGRSRGCHPPGGADPLQNTPVGALGGVDRCVGGPTGGRSAP